MKQSKTKDLTVANREWPDIVDGKRNLISHVFDGLWVLQRQQVMLLVSSYFWSTTKFSICPVFTRLCTDNRAKWNIANFGNCYLYGICKWTDRGIQLNQTTWKRMGCVRFTILYAVDRVQENRPAFVSIRVLCVRNFQYPRSGPMDLVRAFWPVLRSKIWHLLPSKTSCWLSSTSIQTGRRKCKHLPDWFKQWLAVKVKTSDWLVK